MCFSRSPRCTGDSATSASKRRRWRTSPGSRAARAERTRSHLPGAPPRPRRRNRCGHPGTGPGRPRPALRPDRAPDPLLRQQLRAAAVAVPFPAVRSGLAGRTPAERTLPPVLPVRHRHDRRADSPGRGRTDRGHHPGLGGDRPAGHDSTAVRPTVPGRPGRCRWIARGQPGRLLHHPRQARQARLGRGPLRVGRLRTRPQGDHRRAGQDQRAARADPRQARRRPSGPAAEHARRRGRGPRHHHRLPGPATAPTPR